MTLGAAAAPAAGAQADAGTVTNFKFALNAVSVLSSTDAWAVGDSATVLHWNSTAWKRVSALGTFKPESFAAFHEHGHAGDGGH